MLKSKLIRFALPLLLLFCPPKAGSENSVAGSKQKSADSQDGATGTLQKMIVESGSITMDVDLNRLNGTGPATGKLEAGSSRILSELRFAIAANSFFPILVFNNALRGPEPGSIALIPQRSERRSNTAVPSLLGASLNQLVLEKLASGEPFDLAVRHAKTGFVFFNVEGNLYDYDASAQVLSVQSGRLLISKEFANALGRPSDAGSVVGKISVGATLQPIEITQLLNGEPQSAVMPAVGTQPGPDVIVGNLPSLEQFGNAGTQ